MNKYVALILLFVIPLLSFNDFVDYWTVKVNGKLLYDSSKDQQYNKRFEYTVSANAISTKDTLEVQYFTDTPCGNCIYTYFVGEHLKSKGGEDVLGTYSKEQKFLGNRAYKIALQELINVGSKETAKAIYYYGNSSGAQSLCVITVKE